MSPPAVGPLMLAGLLCINFGPGRQHLRQGVVLTPSLTLSDSVKSMKEEYEGSDSDTSDLADLPHVDEPEPEDAENSPTVLLEYQSQTDTMPARFSGLLVDGDTMIDLSPSA